MSNVDYPPTECENRPSRGGVGVPARVRAPGRGRGPLGAARRRLRGLRAAAPGLCDLAGGLLGLGARRPRALGRLRQSASRSLGLTGDLPGRVAKSASEIPDLASQRSHEACGSSNQRADPSEQAAPDRHADGDGRRSAGADGARLAHLGPVGAGLAHTDAENGSLLCEAVSLSGHRNSQTHRRGRAPRHLCAFQASRSLRAVFARGVGTRRRTRRFYLTERV